MHPYRLSFCLTILGMLVLLHLTVTLWSYWSPKSAARKPTFWYVTIQRRVLVTKLESGRLVLVIAWATPDGRLAPVRSVQTRWGEISIGWADNEYANAPTAKTPILSPQLGFVCRREPFDELFWLEVQIPLAVTQVLLTALFLVLGWRVWRRSRRRPGSCRSCGYDLRAHQPGDKCPECGTVVGETSPA